jgi:C4-dicarboxylate-specific signal transduction histidine kinase
MRLRTKLTLVSFAVLLLDAVALVSLGIWVMTGAVNGLSRQILQKELAAKRQKADDLYGVLNRAGLAEADSYVKSVQRELVEEFRRHKFGRTGTIFILEEWGRVVLHPDATGAPLDGDMVREIITQKHGEIEYTHGGQRWLAVFDELPRWGWIIAVALTADEVLETRTTYLKHALLVAICVLLVNGLVMRTVVARLVGRVARTLACVKTVEGGDLAARISGDMPDDEFGSLQKGINSMISVLEKRTAERLAAERELLTAHGQLERRVEERTEELRKAQKAALENAHAAGMAEIATGVLHNIGNALNSVNTSASQIGRIAAESQLKQLHKVTQLVRGHEADLVRFLAEDPRGKELAQFLTKLEEVLDGENRAVREEISRLRSGLDLIHDQIRSQQTYAKTGLHSEEVMLRQAADEVLAMQRVSLERHGVAVVRTHALMRPIRAQRFKLINILLNLIKNASESLQSCPPRERILTVETGDDGDRGPFLRVTDNGAGIAREHLDKVFQYGFTTKKEGHGFGLHFCANAMTEMGGELVAASDGPGRGASFTAYFGKAARTGEQSQRGLPAVSAGGAPARNSGGVRP